MNRSVDPAKKNEHVLIELLKIETNKYCADCNQKGTRWASWNIGVFLCIRCGGLHRSLGTHISKVKSVTLDKWTDEQIESIKTKGNAKVNMIYNPNSDKHPFPSFSGDMENYIRDKYERKLFMVEGPSGSSGPMSLNDSGEKSKKNIMDSFVSSEFSSANDFKTNSFDNSSSNYSKQLSLLSEMGFADSEFNHKILKAANGNMQEALEIIVATNQKQKRKTSERNIFDELEESKSSIISKSPNENEGLKSPPPVHINDWGNSGEISVGVKEEKLEFKILLESDIVPEDVKSIKNTQPSSNPWDAEFVEDLIDKDSTKKVEDSPLDTFKAFKSTPTDTYFDNPW